MGTGCEAILSLNLAMKKTIAVLGLGQSLEAYSGKEDESIGVNDIWGKVQTNYVVVLDQQKRFTPDRVATIEACTPQRLYATQFWKFHLKYYGIEFNNAGFVNGNFNFGTLPKSITSPYVAAAIAYLHKATEIKVYGVDLIDHHTLSDRVKFDRVKNDFISLAKILNNAGVRLAFHNSSRLSEFLPSFS